MDTTIRILSSNTVFKRKCGYHDRIFHADTDPMYRLVSGIYQNGKRRFDIKPVDSADQSHSADHTASNLPGDFLFKRKYNGLFTATILTNNNYRYPIHCSTNC